MTKGIDIVICGRLAPVATRQSCFSSFQSQFFSEVDFPTNQTLERSLCSNFQTKCFKLKDVFGCGSPPAFGGMELCAIKCATYNFAGIRQSELMC